MSNGRKVKMPKKKGAGKIATYQYRVEIGGELYSIQTANALILESMDSKKPGKAEISGEDLVKALKSYNVNVLMPGIENFGIIKKISYREYQGQQVEETEGVGGISEMMKLLSKWETTGKVTVSFEGKVGIDPKKEFNLLGKADINPFTGKTKKA